jgi:hypothetical protein
VLAAPPTCKIHKVRCCRFLCYNNQLMLYTEVMSSRNKKSREMRKAGRTAHFEAGIGGGREYWDSRDNGPHKEGYEISKRNTLAFGPKEQKETGLDWHMKSGKYPTHHPSMEYDERCPKCEALEEDRMHPNGSKPWE